MDKQRAKEIATSPDMKNVTYNGTPIYIEAVKENGTAVIYPLGQPEKEQEVSINSLVEH